MEEALWTRTGVQKGFQERNIYGYTDVHISNNKNDHHHQNKTTYVLIDNGVVHKLWSIDALKQQPETMRGP